jgi:hypothetical protein
MQIISALDKKIYSFKVVHLTYLFNCCLKIVTAVDWQERNRHKNCLLKRRKFETSPFKAFKSTKVAVLLDSSRQFRVSTSDLNHLLQCMYR